jgi:hypothetical protein
MPQCSNPSANVTNTGQTFPKPNSPNLNSTIFIFSANVTRKEIFAANESKMTLYSIMLNTTMYAHLETEGSQIFSAE